MSRILRGIRERQRHIGYVVVCFFLFALALALAKPAGWWAVVALWVALVAMLELVYRWTVALVRRNRRKWWAKPRKDRHWRTQRATVYFALFALSLLIQHPFLRYSLLALLAAGMFCVGIIHLIHRNDQI